MLMLFVWQTIVVVVTSIGTDQTVKKLHVTTVAEQFFLYFFSFP